MDLSIIIVSWNVKELLKKCLASIEKNQGQLDSEIFVIDNASGDGSAKMVKTDFPQIKLIANQTNRGFAAANNQGIKQSQGKYILLLNPDTEILPNALSAMINFMDQNAEIGISGCKLLNPDKTLQFSVRRFPRLKAIILIFLKLAKIWPHNKTLNHYLARDFDYTAAQPVDQVMGAFFLIRQKVIEAIGLLDEKFFIWFEEVDFCRRAKLAGWEVWYYPQAKIIHHGGQSFKQQLTLKKQWQFFQSAFYYFRKYGFKA